MKCTDCNYARTTVNLVRGDCETICKLLKRRINPDNPPKNCPKELKDNVTFQE